MGSPGSAILSVLRVDFLFLFFSQSIGSGATMEGQVSRIGRVKTTEKQPTEF